MLKTCLRIEGKDFGARAAARRLGLGCNSYHLKGDIIKSGPRKGKKHDTAYLTVILSDNNSMPKHMIEVEREIDDLTPFIAYERRKANGTLRIWLSTGTTVGSEKEFARAILAPARLMAKLAAHDMDYEFWAYPCCD